MAEKLKDSVLSELKQDFKQIIELIEATEKKCKTIGKVYRPSPYIRLGRAKKELKEVLDSKVFPLSKKEQAVEALKGLSKAEIQEILDQM